MSKASITADLPGAAGLPPIPGKSPIPGTNKNSGATAVLMDCFKALASLKLTVLLFVLSLILVLCGSLAQVDYGIWTVLAKYFRTWYVWIPLYIFLPRGFYAWHFWEESWIPLTWLRDLLAVVVKGGFPFPGGWTIGWLLLANLLAAHALRFKLSWKRSGIFILHFGLIVMLVGEFITGKMAEERTMPIWINGSTGWVQDQQHTELAIIDATVAARTTNQEVTVPERLLRSGQAIQDSSLPFDIEVRRYMPNSTTRPISEDDDNPATAGEGRNMLAVEKKEGTGVDEESKVDYASAYIQIKDKTTGKPLGAYLVSLYFSGFADFPQHVTVGEGDAKKTYDVYLRWQRTYKPYRIFLRDFHHDNYPGTDTPKDFASDIRLIDPTADVERDTRIYMNHPMRYNGESFYQASTEPYDNGTVLQVVRNPVWLAPYFSCVIVGVGMLVHFSIVLVGFLRKILPTRTVYEFSLNALVVPGGVALLTLVYLGVVFLPTLDAPNAMHLQEASAIPVLGENGRYKPLDTDARILMMIISKRQQFRDKDEKNNQPAVRFELDLLASNLAEAKYPFSKKNPYHKLDPAEPEMIGTFLTKEERTFVIDNENLRALLKLPARNGNKYLQDDFEEELEMAREGRPDAALAGPLQAAMQKSEKKRTEDDRALVELTEDYLLNSQVDDMKADLLKEPIQSHFVFRIENDELLRFLGLENKPEFYRYSLKEFAGRLKDLFREARAAQRKAQEKVELSKFEAKVLELYGNISRCQRVARWKAPAIVPPLAAGGDPLALADAIALTRRTITEIPDTDTLQSMLRAYRDNDAKTFNEQLAVHQKLARETIPNETAKADFEVYFNEVEPFFKCSILYVLMLLCTCCAWIGYAQPSWNKYAIMLTRAAFWLGIITLALHTWGIATRMYLQDRPPITNLYSTAIYIGWLGVILGLILEYIFRIGIGNAVASVVGFCTVFIAHNLATDGETMEPMRAVLDTNFWLATHVVMVNTGYSATFVVGALGILFIGLGILQRLTNCLHRDVFLVLNKMMYGILCFATLTSFVGTVLGGIWADQSWGRFWGWDPKENGALMIVIMNALILHARWGGLVQQRGIAVLSLFGNAITAWSYFGTNMLPGLHSYGGDVSSKAVWLAVFILGNVALAGVGAMPFMNCWKTAGVQKVNPPPPASPAFKKRR